MPITINNVAERAGVSKSTVSRYLNKRYECMSSETRERIAQVIADLDFHPNAVARSLKQKSTHTIAVIVANILNPFSTSAVRGIEDYCKDSGFNLILCNADEDPIKEKEYIMMLMSKQIDGLIINTTGQNNGLLLDISQKIPVVLVDRKVPEVKVDTVVFKNLQGAYQAVEHLIALGHRNIAAFIALPYKSISPRTERFAGYKQALHDFGIPVKSDYIVETILDEQLVLNKLRQLMNLSEKPTAVFGINNLMTMALIKALRKLELSIPKDVAVVGVDDWEWAELFEPPITVVAKPNYDMGMSAAKMLIKRIGSTGKRRRAVLVEYEPTLIVRKSCGEDGKVFRHSDKKSGTE